MAAGIRHGVHDYEATELSSHSSQNSFGVLFNEATRVAILVRHLEDQSIRILQDRD